MGKNKTLILVIALVITLTLLVAGITYAAYTWSTHEVVSGTADCFNINYVKGQDLGSANDKETLIPSEDYTGGLYAMVMISTDRSCNIQNALGKVYLTTDESTSPALLNSGALKYQVIDNSLTLGNSGTITSTGTMLIDEEIGITDYLKHIIVAVWLDTNLINEDNLDEIFVSTYSGSISMTAESGDLNG